jgi:trk system potassium uptake protein TrkA
MRIIVMGCGRVGSAVAEHFGAGQHDVRVVDRNKEARAALPNRFPGQFIVGNGFNRAILEQAGIAGADAFVAVTSGDNSNIVGARIAKEVFQVPLVLARIYDPRRAEIYRGLGISTVASVSWTVHQIERMLRYRYLTPEASFGSGETLLVRVPVPAYLAGRRASEFEIDGEIRAVVLTRLGFSSVVGSSTTLMDQDELTLAVAADALPRLQSFLNTELGS